LYFCCDVSTLFLNEYMDMDGLGTLVALLGRTEVTSVGKEGLKA